MQLASAPREFSGQRGPLGGRWCGPAPLPRGTPSWCHGFCQRENFVIEKFITAPLQACKNARHREAAPTAHTAER